MGSPEMRAGSAGHAFLAAWYTTHDITQALAAFDAADRRPVPPARPGWYSDSALGRFGECPTQFYLSRLHRGTGVERVYPEKDPKALSAEADKVGALLAATKDACQWMVDSGNTADERYVTWATEMYLETPPPFRFRMWVDQLVWDRETDTLGIRDHKFTFRNDLRTGARLLYADQLLLYAATWNRCVPRWAAATGGVVRLPLIDFLIPHVVVVSTRGAHLVMPADPKFLTPQREARFWSRLWRTQQALDAFAAQSHAGGIEFAFEYMQTRSCYGFGPCAFIPVCHEDVDPDGPPYKPSTRGAAAPQEEL